MKITSHRNEFTLTGTHSDLEALAELANTTVSAYAEYGDDLSDEEERAINLIIAANKLASELVDSFTLDNSTTDTCTGRTEGA